MKATISVLQYVHNTLIDCCINSLFSSGSCLFIIDMRIINVSYVKWGIPFMPICHSPQIRLTLGRHRPPQVYCIGFSFLGVECSLVRGLSREPQAAHNEGLVSTIMGIFVELFMPSRLILFSFCKWDRTTCPWHVYLRIVQYPNDRINTAYFIFIFSP